MNALARDEQSNHPCPDLATMAEREFSAFFNAVAQLFGSEQAALSAENWLREIVEVDGVPTSARDWRSITVKALSRLASRVTASSRMAERQIA